VSFSGQFNPVRIAELGRRRGRLILSPGKDGIGVHLAVPAGHRSHPGQVTGVRTREARGAGLDRDALHLRLDRSGLGHAEAFHLHVCSGACGSGPVHETVNHGSALAVWVTDDASAARSDPNGGTQQQGAEHTHGGHASGDSAHIGRPAQGTWRLPDADRPGDRGQVGASGAAVKLAYKTAASFVPGYFRNTLQDMVPRIVDELEPHWADFSNSEFGDRYTLNLCVIRG
jgi:hypothetical protein